MENIHNKTEQLRKIRDEVVDCTKCSLYTTRTLPVVGVGSHDAKIIFVGEAPGANEDATGIPFCGRAGKVLDEVLESAGIKREDVYICNVLKCRPPGNRDPLPAEKSTCVDYLKKQIEIIQPKIICTLGNHATDFIFKEFGLESELRGISKIHGKVFVAPGFRIVSLYHPAVATYNPKMRQILLEDIKVLGEFI